MPKHLLEPYRFYKIPKPVSYTHLDVYKRQGWSGGPYGVGERINLQFTRAMITAALQGQLENVEYSPHRIFGVMMPRTCPGVPSEILSPRYTWKSEAEYDEKAKELANMFVQNFKKYESGVSREVLFAGPKIS